MMRMKRYALGVGASLMLALAAGGQVHAKPVNSFPQEVVKGPPIALVGGTVVDVVSGKTVPGSTIIVHEGRIMAVGPAASVAIPADARVVDMKGKWLMPGLVNMHVHFGLILPGAQGAALASETAPQLALRMAENARKSLLAGVTSVRLVNTKGWTDFALKQAIDRGAIPGPRIETVGESIVPTGGHGTRQVDGPFEFAKAVRDQVQQGATWIKIATSGGISDSLGSLDSTPMTDEEMAAVMDTARRNSVKVTAHNGSSVAAMQAIKYGINCFEHGYQLNPEVLQAMAAKKVFLVPTIVVSQKGAQEFFAKIGSPPWYLEKVKAAGEAHWKMLQTAIKLGVPIAAGTDQMPFEPNEGTTATVREVELYVDAGMSPIQAIRSATSVAADLMGTGASVGSLAQGKYADIIALDGDPIADIHALRTISFVMKNGRVVRDDRVGWAQN